MAGFTVTEPLAPLGAKPESLLVQVQPVLLLEFQVSNSPLPPSTMAGSGSVRVSGATTVRLAGAVADGLVQIRLYVYVVVVPVDLGATATEPLIGSGGGVCGGTKAASFGLLSAHPWA